MGQDGFLTRWLSETGIYGTGKKVYWSWTCTTGLGPGPGPGSVLRVNFVAWCRLYRQIIVSWFYQFEFYDINLYLLHIVNWIGWITGAGNYLVKPKRHMKIISISFWSHLDIIYWLRFSNLYFKCQEKLETTKFVVITWRICFLHLIISIHWQKNVAAKRNLAQKIAKTKRWTIMDIVKACHKILIIPVF
jgi:hypothetical protein